MQDDLKEQLSAAIDGELTQDETRFLARRLANDPESLAQLARYYDVAAASRREYVPGAEQMVSRVADALTKEPVHDGRAPGWQRWLQPVGGAAIAASVALALVMAWPMISGTPEQSATIAQSTSGGLQPGSGHLSVTDERLQLASQPATISDANIRQRLNPYLVNHSEHAAFGQLGGTLKYARIVSHDAER